MLLLDGPKHAKVRRAVIDAMRTTRALVDGGVRLGNEEIQAVAGAELQHAAAQPSERLSGPSLT